MDNYWQNKQVAVTGGRGMIGSWLVDFLLAAGAKVTVMDTGVRGKNHNPFARYIDVRQADCTSPGRCGAVFRNKDVVFNLAAEVGGIYHNLNHQTEQFVGNMHLQMAPVLGAVSAKVPVFVQVSTVCVYPDSRNNPAYEEDGHIDYPEGSNAGYAWAKRMGERVAHWAFAGTQTRYMIVRFTNAYGTRDYFDDRPHVIPALIKKFCSELDPVPVYGGDQTREFIYDQDAARGIMAAAERGLCGEVYNVGTSGDTTISISGLAETIRYLCQSNAKIDYVQSEPTGDMHRCTDSSKIHALGWYHLVSLKEGLDHTVRSYRERQRGNAG